MQNFGGQIRCIMGDVQVAYSLEKVRDWTMLCRIAPRDSTGLFWGRNLFFYWVLKSYTRNSAKIRPSNRPVVQSDRTQTQSQWLSKHNKRRTGCCYNDKACKCTQTVLNARVTARKRAKCRAREEAHFRVSVGKLTLLDNCISKSYVKIKGFFLC